MQRWIQSVADPLSHVQYGPVFRSGSQGILPLTQDSSPMFGRSEYLHWFEDGPIAEYRKQARGSYTGAFWDDDDYGA